jgi:TolB-like protein
MVRGQGICFLLASAIIWVTCCAAPPTRPEQGAAVAVWDLENLSPSPTGQPDLGEILSGQIIETLKKGGDYLVVERRRLLLALEELRLGTTALADESTRLRLGKLVGARWMIFGGYLAVGGEMRLDLRLVEVETGKVRRAVEKTTSSRDFNDWMAAVRKATEELL